MSVRAFWKAFLRTRMPLWCTASNVFKGPRFVAKMFWGFPNFQGSLLSLRWGTCGGGGVAAAALRALRSRRWGGPSTPSGRRSYRYGVAAKAWALHAIEAARCYGPRHRGERGARVAAIDAPRGIEGKTPRPTL